jgi:succinate dehydrogenase / fumarate reductase iron-sulfur subunit
MARLRILRYSPEDGTPRFVTYDIEGFKGATVLDGLYKVKHEVDGSLAFRSSCRSAICGSCAMTINGKNRLACKTQIEDLKSPITVEPLTGYPLLKDLVVDMVPFWDQYQSIRPHLITDGPMPEGGWRQSPEERKLLDDPARCIMCGACSSSCPVIWTDRRYLGPAALLKVWRFVADTRDQGTAERLDMISNEFGVWRCHTIFRCVDSCPKDINPTEAIEHLRRAAIRQTLFGKRRRR